GQVAGQRVEQVALLGVELDCGSEEQVDLAEHLLMQLDGHRNQRSKSRAPAMIHRRGGLQTNRNHADLGAVARLAAMALARFETGSGLDHVLRKAVRCEHQIALVTLIGPTYHRPISLRYATNLPHETARQLIEAGGMRHEGADFVKVG